MTNFSSIYLPPTSDLCIDKLQITDLLVEKLPECGITRTKTKTNYKVKLHDSIIALIKVSRAWNAFFIEWIHHASAEVDIDSGLVNLFVIGNKYPAVLLITTFFFWLNPGFMHF